MAGYGYGIIMHYTTHWVTVRLHIINPLPRAFRAQFRVA